MPPPSTMIAFVLLLSCAALCCGGEGTGARTWRASPALVRALGRRRPGVLYEESRVPEYTLPDPLVATDGTRVADAETWRTKRRPELLELFRRYEYGRAPVERPPGLRFELFEHGAHALGGTATRKQIAVWFTGRSTGPRMDLLVYLPNGARRPAPVFVLLNFGGNHTIHPDPAIRVTTSWVRQGDEGATSHRATAASRGKAARRFPVDLILQRGYALATAYYGDLDPDYDDGFHNGVHGVFDRLRRGKRAPDAWGALGAWAWGLSRALDYFETDPDLDEHRVIVLGHSRLGKAALWAAARDERFAAAVSNDSGCGGAALSRRRFGETVARINRSFPHWFCGNFKAFDDREDELPVDQHELVALIAPRPAYVASADEDLWADPRGEFLAVEAADPVYRLLGTDGLPTATMPPLNHPVQGTLGYHVRRGKHDLTTYDWNQYLDFADKHLRR